MNFIIYLFLQRLLPLSLTGWWVVKLKSPWRFNYYMIGFSFSYQILTQLKKFLLWRCFIPKAPVLHQFHQFPDKYLCGPSCFKNMGSQSGKKFLVSTTVKFPIRNLNHGLQNSQPDYKEQKLIHSWFFEPINNNASSSAAIAYLNILIFSHFL